MSTMRNGCPEDCGVCDTCGSTVCQGNHECSGGMEHACRCDHGENHDFDSTTAETGLNMQVFTVLADFVAMLAENVDMEVEVLPEMGRDLVRNIVDAAVLMTLTEMVAMRGDF